MSKLSAFSSLKFILIVSIFLVFMKVTWSEEHYPAQLFYLNDFLSHHILIAEKSTHKLYLFENSNSYPKLLKTYQMATGKKSGDKAFRGDHRTPEGIYVFTNFLTRDDLLRRYGKKGEIYGIGSFVMNYPNPMDSRANKTGGGIWLHSTNDETRIEKGLDSRGCIVIANDDLKDISKYLEINKTQIIVTHGLNYVNKDNWEITRKSLLDFTNNWKNAWANEDYKEYKNFYNPNEFYDPNKGDFNSYMTYKKNVFWSPGKPDIEIKNMNILKTNKYATVSFIQHYKSNSINDVGKKTLYLKQDEYYNWKIVAERWTKTGVDGATNHNDQVAFRPSNRFFNNTTSPTSNN